MNFTKQYIKECDCKEIQGLRYGFEFGDFFTHTPEYTLGSQTIHVRSDHFDAIEQKNTKGYTIWLPTGDQLDDEIVKIVDKFRYDKNDYKEHIRYDFRYFMNPIPNSVEYIYSAHVLWFSGDIEDWEGIEFREKTNPLIAKIKLLKALIKP